MQQYQLTEQANFPESDAAAIRQLAEVQDIIMEFMDGFVTLSNADRPDALELWRIAKGLNAAITLYGE